MKKIAFIVAMLFALDSHATGFTPVPPNTATTFGASTCPAHQWLTGSNVPANCAPVTGVDVFGTTLTCTSDQVTTLTAGVISCKVPITFGSWSTVLGSSVLNSAGAGQSFIRGGSNNPAEHGLVVDNGRGSGGILSLEFNGTEESYFDNSGGFFGPGAHATTYTAGPVFYLDGTGGSIGYSESSNQISTWTPLPYPGTSLLVGDGPLTLQAQQGNVTIDQVASGNGIEFKTDNPATGNDILINGSGSGGIDVHTGNTDSFTINGGSLTLNSGIAAGAGFKHQRGATGCTTAASVGATCTTTVTWGSAFANTSYTCVCTGRGITSGVPVYGGLTATAAASCTVQTVAMTAVAAKFTNIDCIGIHD